MIDSTNRDDRTDPFRLLVVRRAEAERAGTDRARAERNALNEAATTILTVATAAARLFDENDRPEAVSSAMLKISALCKRIYDGELDRLPRETWIGLVTTIVRNCGRDAHRRESRGGVRGASGAVVLVPLDAPGPTGMTLAERFADPAAMDPEEYVLERDERARRQAAEDARARRVSWLLTSDQASAIKCPFHPGERCAHVVTGRMPKSCVYRALVLEIVAESFMRPADEPVNPVLIARTGLDPHTQGNDIRRRVYCCVDWFSWWLLMHDPHPSPAVLALRQRREERLIGHLAGSGRDAPSAATVCLLLNDYPDLPIPQDLRNMYGPNHVGRFRGELR